MLSENIDRKTYISFYFYKSIYINRKSYPRAPSDEAIDHRDHLLELSNCRQLIWSIDFFNCILLLALLVKQN